MKKKIISTIFFISLVYYISAEYKKDSFAIVNIPNRQYLKIYSEPDTNSSIINEIPSGFKNIIVTWRTFNDNNNYWIEIKYNNKKGWINRKYITRYFGFINKNQEKKIENLLINLTKSLQQKDYDIFKNLFYFLRGINIYNSKNKDIINFEYKELNQLWESIFEENNKSIKIFSDILQILESDFDIEYNIKNINHNLPIELKNFQYIILTYDYKTLYIGLEFWDNEPYFCSFCLF